MSSGGFISQSNRNDELSKPNFGFGTKATIDFFGQQGLNAPISRGGASSNASIGAHGTFANPTAITPGSRAESEFNRSKGTLAQFVSARGLDQTINTIFKNSNLSKEQIRNQLGDLGFGPGGSSGQKTSTKTTDPKASSEQVANTIKTKKRGRGGSPGTVGILDSAVNRKSLLGE